MRKKHYFKLAAKGVASVVCVGALVASQGSLIAFAADESWSYPVPSSPTTVDKSLVTFGSQGDIWGEILGLSDVTRNYSSDFNSDGTINADGVAKDVVANLFGSDVNTNPNPYYANLLYNSKASESEQVDHYNFSDKCGLWTGIDRGDATLVDAYGGVSATMSMRPDIVMGNCATSWQDPGAIVLRSDGVTPVSVSNYELAVSAAYDSQVTTIRSLDSDSAYYQKGDSTYNPYYVENLSMYGDVTDAVLKSGIERAGADTDFYGDENTKYLTAGAATVASTYAQLYNIAKAAEGVLESDSSKTTRYGDPMEIAQQYESYGRGLQDYVLSKIADGTVEKKTVAVVYDVDTENNTVTLYQNSPAGTVQGTGGSFSGPYKHMEVLENVCDNVAGTRSLDDYKMSWGSKSYTVTKVLTDVSELKKADAIILCYNSDEENLKTVLEAAGITEAETPAMFTNYATSTSRGIPGFPMLQTDGLEMEAEELGFVYPEIINPVYALAYYYTQFYHVKSDTTTLSNVLSYNIENMSLPKGVTADLSNYSDSIIDKAIKKGLRYYAAHKDAIDAAHPKLTTTSYLTIGGEDITEATVSGIKDSYVFNYEEQTPKVTVTLDGDTLVAGDDYSVSYKDNYNVGTATVTISGKGAFTGTITKTFSILQASSSMSAGAVKAKFAKSTKTQTTTIRVSKAVGDVYYSSNKSGVTVNSRGKVTIAKNFSGTVKITVEDTGNDNVAAGSKTLILKVG